MLGGATLRVSAEALDQGTARVERMKNALPLLAACLLLTSCASARCPPPELSRSLVLYDHQQIPAGIGISRGPYTPVDGFRYVNIMVEFEQHASDERPVSLGVTFAQDSGGSHSSRRYFSFDENLSGPAHPQMITVTGAHT